MADSLERKSADAKRLILIIVLIVPAAFLALRWGWPLFSREHVQPSLAVLSPVWLAQAFASALIAAIAFRIKRRRLAFAPLAWPFVDLFGSLPFMPRYDPFDQAGVVLLAVTVGIYLGWLIRPFAGPGERMRRALWRHVVMREFRRRENAKVGAGRILLGMGVATLTLIPMAIPWIMHWLDTPPTPFPSAAPPTWPLWLIPLLIPVLGCYYATTWSTKRFARNVREEAVAEKPCFRCFALCADAPFDENGWGRCPGCGVPVHAGQWNTPPCASDQAMSGALRASFTLKRLPVIAVMAALMGIGLASLTRVGDSLGLDSFFIIVFLLLPLPGVIRIFRLAAARVIDRQHIECRECGYDLRATPVTQGVGTCPECGTRFARLTRQTMAESDGL